MPDLKRVTLQSKAHFYFLTPLPPCLSIKGAGKYRHRTIFNEIFNSSRNPGKKDHHVDLWSPRNDVYFSVNRFFVLTAFFAFEKYGRIIPASFSAFRP